MITFYRPSEPPEFPRIPLEDVSFPVLNAAFGAFMVEAGVYACCRLPIASKQVNTDVEEQDGDGDATLQPDEMEIHHYGGKETQISSYNWTCLCFFLKVFLLLSRTLLHFFTCVTAFNKISPSTECFQETIPICWPPGNIYIQGSQGIGEEHAGWRENGEEREWGVSLFLPLLAIPAPSLRFIKNPAGEWKHV